MVNTEINRKMNFLAMRTKRKHPVLFHTLFFKLMADEQIPFGKEYPYDEDIVIYLQKLEEKIEKNEQVQHALRNWDEIDRLSNFISETYFTALTRVLKNTGSDEDVRLIEERFPLFNKAIELGFG